MNPIYAIASWLSLLLAKLLLRFAPDATLRHLAASETGCDGFLDRSAAELVSTFGKVARVHPLQPPCLERAIALQMLLLSRGTRPKLRIGLGREESRFPGHAWLELNDEPVGEHATIVARFAKLAISPQGIATALRHGRRSVAGDTNW